MGLLLSLVVGLLVATTSKSLPVAQLPKDPILQNNIPVESPAAAATDCVNASQISAPAAAVAATTGDESHQSFAPATTISLHETSQRSRSDPANPLLIASVPEVEQDSPPKDVSPRWVGRAKHWLMNREGAIHGSNSSLKWKEGHTVVPWGDTTQGMDSAFGFSLPVIQMPETPHIPDFPFIQKLFGLSGDHEEKPHHE